MLRNRLLLFGLSCNRLLRFRSNGIIAFNGEVTRANMKLTLNGRFADYNRLVIDLIHQSQYPRRCQDTSQFQHTSQCQYQYQSQRLFHAKATLIQANLKADDVIMNHRHQKRLFHSNAATLQGNVTANAGNQNKVDGPINLYQQRVNEGVLREDLAQREALMRLETLYNKLKNYNPPDPLTLLQNQAERDELSYLSSLNVDDLDADQVKRKTFLTENIKSAFIPPMGLYVNGPVGTGKTMLMDLFYDSIEIKAKKRVHFHAFMISLYSRIHQWNMQNRKSAGRNEGPISDIADWLLEDAWLICFDEFQVTDVGTAATLYNLFRCIFERGAVIVTTSNRHLQELHQDSFQKKSFGPLVELMTNHCQVHSMNSEHDYRLALYEFSNSKENNVYLSPINENNQKIFDELFAKATAKETVAENYLTIYGRKIHVPFSSETHARFTFAELFQRNYGPSDYIGICNRYPNIFIQDVPKMGFFQKNEARRFITFIDAAYESKTKVHFLAADEPENLFCSDPEEVIKKEKEAFDVMHLEMVADLLDELQEKSKKQILTPQDQVRLSDLSLFSGEDERFAFKRAVSRLKEMQSDYYLLLPHHLDKTSISVSDSNLLYHQQQLAFQQFKQEKNPESELQNKRFFDRKERNQREEEEGEPRISDDFAMEADNTSWVIDRQRKKRMIKEFNLKNLEGDVAQKKNVKKPRFFLEQHFWGFGWWELVKNKLKK